MLRQNVAHFQLSCFFAMWVVCANERCSVLPTPEDPRSPTGNSLQNESEHHSFGHTSHIATIQARLKIANISLLAKVILYYTILHY